MTHRPPVRGAAERPSAARLVARVATVALLAVGLAAGCQPSNGTVTTPIDTYARAVAARGFPVVLGRPIGDDAETWYRAVLDHPDATWMASALVASDEYRIGPGRGSDEAFIDQAYRKGFGRAPSESEMLFWRTAMANWTTSRAGFAAWVMEQGFGSVLIRPVGVACTGYDQGGLAPQCTPGADGSPSTVLVQVIGGTTIVTNVAWSRQVQGLVEEARSVGFTLDAYQDPNVPYPAGSFRSNDTQRWLYTHGYPANPPGKSMHEWGMAIDLACDGDTINRRPACWNWVRGHGPAHGVFAFAKATTISSSEAWHFSSNGR